jgi:hypothetical protein
MNRREFIHSATLAASGLMLAPSIASASESSFPVVRIPEAKRKFKSVAVARTIATVQSSIGNKELAWMFGNCFPNTLDTRSVLPKRHWGTIPKLFTRHMRRKLK